MFCWIGSRLNLKYYGLYVLQNITKEQPVWEKTGVHLYVNLEQYFYILEVGHGTSHSQTVLIDL